MNIDMRILIRLEMLKVELVQAQAHGRDNHEWLAGRCGEIITEMQCLLDELESANG